MVFGAGPLLLAVFISSGDAPEWTGSFVAALLYNIFLGTGTALLLWFYALRALPAGTAGLLSLATPVVGVVAAWIQLGERPGAAEALGMVLILCSLAFLALRQLLAGRSLNRRE
jgi:drug/metabolite transporter (DMT)-like permease